MKFGSVFELQITSVMGIRRYVNGIHQVFKRFIYLFLLSLNCVKDKTRTE